MRISDWSSDVCSSDLLAENLGQAGEPDREVIRTYGNPLKHNAGYVVLGGNLFDSAIIKTCVIDDTFRERFLSDPGHPNVAELNAVVFEGPEDYHARIEDPDLGIDAIGREHA